jgi:hypothetical protein
VLVPSSASHAVPSPLPPVATLEVPALLTRMLAVVVGCAALQWLDAELSHRPSPWVDVGTLVLLALTLAAGSWRLVASEPLRLWSPLPWCLLALAVYAGWGPLCHYVVDERAIAELARVFPVDDVWLRRTNLLNSLGSAATLCGFLGVHLLERPGAQRAPAVRGHPGAAGLALAFLAIGVTTRLLFLLPGAWGAAERGGGSGLLGFFSSFSLAGTVLATYVAATGRRLWGLFAALGLAADVALSMLSLFLARPAPRRLVGWGLAIAMLYVVISPIVGSARIVLAHTTLGQHGGLPERVRALQVALAAGRGSSVDVGPRRWGWWTRLSYANAQAHAMDAHDRGHGVDTYAYALATLVPRALWPEKPRLTDLGRDQYERVTGQRGASLGIGVHGEAYYNGGWWLVIGVGFAVGALLAVLGRLVEGAMRRGCWEVLPSALLVLRMGVRIDGWFVTDFLGAGVIALGGFLLLRAARVLLPGARV